MKIRTLNSVLSLALLALSTLGCGEAVKPPSDTPIIRKSNQPLISREKCSSGSSARISECICPAYEVVLTLNKAFVLGHIFQYSLEIQYSSLSDGDSKPNNQSVVEGNIPVQFRIVGNSLELIKDNASQPAELIGQFPILKLDDKEITVRGLDSAPYLATQAASINGAAKNISFLDHWLSSFDFDLGANVMLQETSLKLSDGKTLVKFMESITPSDSSQAGSTTGSNELSVKRFRLLPLQGNHCGF